jgi:hypothetical protein
MAKSPVHQVRAIYAVAVAVAVVPSALRGAPRAERETPTSGAKAAKARQCT